jgi:peptidoglycan/LPS O-acetylase OafA/YrhL
MALTQQRKDIQGLRALAVLLVVAGHLFPTVLKGGFIGVDIFFVISGFVITAQMLKSYLVTEKGFLLNFYARRIRRILPSALLVSVVTIWATGYFLGPVASNNATLDAGWSTVFLSNFHFQATALDYFAAGTQVSPLQHFWSLSIEEQFYLFWPAIFIALFARPLSMRTRQLFLGAVISISLFAAIFQSTISDSPIFFSSVTRVWELAAGALLALTSKSIKVAPTIAAALVLFLIACAFLIPQSMQWPRLTTIPVIAASVILLLRNSRLNSFSFLENRVATYLGDISYIIYLWHWPILTIVKSYYGKFTVQEIALVIALTAMASITTHHLFENPIRYSQVLIKRPVPTVVCGVTAISITAATLFTNHIG